MTDEQRKERLNYHMYTTCETPAEHAERIVALEELVQDMDMCIAEGAGHDCDQCHLFMTSRCAFDKRMSELGVPHEWQANT